MRVCKTCKQALDESLFYASRPRKCKSCVILDVQSYRQKNLDEVRRKDRARGRTPERKEYQRRVRELSKPNSRGYQARWCERNPEKRAAHVVVGNAVRSGKLVKQPCEVCGSEKVHAHHDDHSRPLDVRWLCHDHHGEVSRRYA